MNSKVCTRTINLGDGREITLETGKLARQADGAVVVRMGDTVLLATAVSARESKEDVDFMPLSCEYREKYASYGRFPGGFLKRETRPSDYEVIVSRLVDRALRPLFPDDFHAETFVNVMLISGDKEVMPDALAGLAASAALAVSDIPFNGPISEVRVSRVEGQFILNPTFEQNTQADMDIIVAATIENIMMVEGEMSEVSETDLLEAIKFAHQAIKVQCQAQLDLASDKGVTGKREVPASKQDAELLARMERELYGQVYAVAKELINNKQTRGHKFDAIRQAFIDSFSEEELPDMFLIKQYFHDIEKKAVRRMILDERVRLDGRKTDEIRQISCDVDYLPSTHGSGVFTRGETQSLTTVTLGSKMDEQMIDGASIKGYEKFILHYNFPPFSTNEARPSRGTSRREIGHGNLAYRALKRMVPNVEEGNPYTVRVVSDILESNGSSSMATVCAGTLALMDAGVKLKKPVSGIAMGLITEKDSDKFAVLSDILGDEDHLGDMDFKVAGTRDGITATQMDIKVDGLPYEILAQALEQARNGRLHILDKLTEAIAEPRADYKDFVPRIEKMFVAKEFIGAIIGPGGKVIQDIQKDTGATIVIEEVDERGIIDIVSANKDSIERAKARIRAIVAVPEVGEVYEGVVKSITAFGAFVEILPGKDGLLHISEIDHMRVSDIDKYFKVGERIQVKLIEIDPKTDKMRLSRKVLIPKPDSN